MSTTTLRKISIGYLLLPNVLFIYGWFKPEIAAPVIAILLYMFYQVLRKRSQPNDTSLSTYDIAFLLLIGTVLTFFSGSGGYSHQYIDWWGHNSKFYDLYTSEWPYYFTEVNRLVRYYFGYYLVPSLIFKLIGGVVPSVIFAWTCLGFVIGISWIYILIYKNKYFLLISLFLGGCGHIIYSLAIHFGFIIEEGPSYWLHFFSIFDHLMWAPNQLIPGLIIPCILYYDIILQERHESSLFPISLTLIWAIFPFISICIIYTALFFYKPKYQDLLKVKTLKDYFFPIVHLLPVALYFSAGGKPAISGFIWDFEKEGPVLTKYTLGILLDASIFYLFISRVAFTNNFYNNILIKILFTTFITFTFYRIGKWNDWFSKMNIPFLTFSIIIIFRAVYLHSSIIFKRRYALVYGLLICTYLTLTFAEEYFRIRNALFTNVVTSLFTNQKFSSVPYNSFGSFYNTMINKWSYEEAEQYMAQEGSFFEQYMMKNALKPTITAKLSSK